MIISKEHFYAWKKDAVTKKVFYSLRKEIEVLNKMLIDENIIKDQSAFYKLHEILGYRKAYEWVLCMEQEDLIDNESEE